MIRTVKLLGVLTFLCLLTASAVAQVASAELHVAVRDGNGAVVRNASIVARNQTTNVERTQTTNTDGEYAFRALPPGHYEVTVTSPGFAKAIAKDVTLTVGQIAEFPIALQVASVSEVVNVSSQSEIVETQRSSAATTIDQTRIDNLPTNGRNYINFALTNSQLARDTAPSIGAAPTSGLNVGGQRARSNQVNVDGMDAVDNSTNGIRSTVSQEAVQEFQLLTNGYAAEYGRASGGVVNIITKSGSNDLHGTAYGFLRNRKIQAVNPFSTIPDPAYTRVQAGFSLGGPIKKDRDYYFLSFEETRRRESGYSSIGANNFGLTAVADVGRFYGLPTGALVLPVTQQQAGIIPLLPVNSSTQRYVTLTAIGGFVALNGFNPLFPSASNKYFAAFTSDTLTPIPLPASFATLNSLKGNFPIKENTGVWSARIDHKINNNQQFLLRGGFSPSQVDGIQVNAQGPQNFGQNAYSRTSRQDVKDWNITGQHGWTIGTNKVNELRYQFSRRGLLYSYSNAPGGQNVAVNIPGIAFFGREPFSYVKRTEKRHQVTDSFSWTKGHHNIKFGGDVNYLPLTADFTVNFGGIYNFGDITADPSLPNLSPVQAYGSGLPQNFIQGVGNPHDEFSNKTLGLFVQDSLRIAHNLTLNYGVRYDVEFTPTFAASTPISDAAQKQLGITQGIPRDYNNFAPRVGLAWDPWSDGKTVIRASYGIFYDHPLLALAFNSDVADGTQAPQIVLFGGSPTSGGAGCNMNAANTFTGILNCPGFTFLGNQQRFNPTANTSSLWTNQNFLTAGVPLTMLPFGFPTAKNFQYAYSNQANLTLEHDFGGNFSLSLGYNFNGGRHLNRPINANAVRTDLLVRNWQLAMADPLVPASVKAGFANDPRQVITSGVVGGVPYFPAAAVNFFRRSGINTTLVPFGSPTYLAIRGALNAFGLPDMGVVPFSDMPANYANGSSVYHGLTVNGRKRFSNHYEFLASYTWSHSIDDSTDLESPLSPQDNYNPKAERSASLFDQRHRLVISGVFQSGRRGPGVKNLLMSDWTLAPIIEIASGRPFNIITGIDQNFDFGTTTDRPMMANGIVTNSCGQTSVASRYSPTGFLIPACFKDGQTTGNLPRNAGTRPWNEFIDLRVARRIHLSERMKLDAIADAFNIFNINNTADVNPLWNLAGQPSAAFDPRQIQVALRLTW